MQILFDFLPVVAFFIAYKIAGIYIACAAAILISVLQAIFLWFKYHKISILQLISLGIIIVFGGGTLLLHNELLIKWKPTILSWLLAIIFLGSQFFAEKPFIQRIMEKNINLPHAIWINLNLSWVIFFCLMGASNIFVAYIYSTNVWVNFKLFGMFGLTFAFAIGQAIYLAKHIDNSAKNSHHE